MFDQQCKYGILGMARSGIAAAYKIKTLGGLVFLSELLPESEVHISADLRRDFDCEFGGHSDRLLACDKWIVSPGIPLDVPIIRKGIAAGIKIISEIEFAFTIKSPDSKLIAITGSNGKSTTSSLIHHLLNELGYKSLLAGNIGDAVSGFSIEKPGYDYIVLEVSSFQLDLIDTFHPDVAVLMNITPDHLNRYASFSHYARTKFRIFENQTESDYAILYKNDAQIMSRIDQVRARKMFFSSHYDNHNVDAWMNEVFIHVYDSFQLSKYNLGIRGPHNYSNAMAALLAVDVMVNRMEEAMEHITRFRPLNHRLEFVRTINGISFYNDSKATNTDSVRNALLSFDKPIRIILGGSDKGEDFSVLTDLLKEKAIKAYITGGTLDRMRQTWLGKVPLLCEEDFEGCIHRAFEESDIGDNIVLSPACASFDYFKNFEHRGETFKFIVDKIAAEYEKN
ncbi:MAG: UDP-N-acetylmuramoyl-L-alanine--D-glutamate ligase [Candidatus Cloacimonetes bacterium]|nr:UDP-N-acetylmuramoyl-L-alanine--D-glutamate ligase [Candidatus Cloacimonadota bacterium]